jgi:hypothetical protein
MKTFKATWSKSLIIISWVASLLCLGISIGMLLSSRGKLVWAASLPLLIVIGAAPFTIRGYALTADAILVRRLFWNTRLILTGFKSAQFVPDAMRSSIRTFGNGGLFSFTGFFYNKALGSYRAFVTNPHNTVVLHFSKRTVVLSPAEPEEFVRDLSFAFQGS